MHFLNQVKTKILKRTSAVRRKSLREIVLEGREIKHRSSTVSTQRHARVSPKRKAMFFCVFYAIKCSTCTTKFILIN